MLYADFLKTITECPFCNADEKKNFMQNDCAYLTYALAPYHADHLMVIPKRHMELISEPTDAEMKDIFELQKKGIEALRKLGYENLSVIVREGDGSGKTIPHLHFHIIPNTRLGDVDHMGMHRVILTDDEASIQFERIKNAIS